MNKPIIGYIVFIKTGPLEWYVWPDDGLGSLLHGDGATLFHTRRQAHLAVQKTIRWAEGRGIKDDSYAEELRGAGIFSIRCGEPSRWKKVKP